MKNVSEYQSKLKELGFYAGVVDGLSGVKTQEAIKAFQRTYGLKEDGKYGPATEAELFPDLSKERKPTLLSPAGQSHAIQFPRQKDVISFYGAPGNSQCTAGKVILPYPMRLAWDKNSIVSQFSCHAKVAANFQNIFEQTLNQYGLQNIKKLGLDIFGGCYNLRKMRGGSAYSMHSWGIAVDLDPANNQLKWGRDKASFAKSDYESFWQIVESEGGVSLGRVKNFDWMHFQFARL